MKIPFLDRSTLTPMPRQGRSTTINENLCDSPESPFRMHIGITQQPGDMFFLAALALCVLLAVAAVGAGFERKTALQQIGGARKIDLQAVRIQIQDGNLSSHKALFFKRVPR